MNNNRHSYYKAAFFGFLLWSILTNIGLSTIFSTIPRSPFFMVVLHYANAAFFCAIALSGAYFTVLYFLWKKGFAGHARATRQICLTVAVLSAFFPAYLVVRTISALESVLQRYAIKEKEKQESIDRQSNITKSWLERIRLDDFKEYGLSFAGMPVGLKVVIKVTAPSSYPLPDRRPIDACKKMFNKAGHDYLYSKASVRFSWRNDECCGDFVVHAIDPVVTCTETADAREIEYSAEHNFYPPAIAYVSEDLVSKLCFQEVSEDMPDAMKRGERTLSFLWMQPFMGHILNISQMSWATWHNDRLTGLEQQLLQREAYLTDSVFWQAIQSQFTPERLQEKGYAACERPNPTHWENPNITLYCYCKR